MLVAADQETFPIKHLQTCPPLVCLSTWDARGPGLIGNDDKAALEERLTILFRDHTTIWHNGCSFDLAVAVTNFPSLMPHVCQALEEGRVRDTKIREKLLALATHGNIRLKTLPNGVVLPLKYRLEDLAKNYLKKDRSAQKAGSFGKGSGDDEDEDPRGDAWRYNYDSLDGIPAEEYPDEARDYAIEDAQDTWNIFHAQEERLNRAYRIAGFPYSLPVEAVHVASGFYLYLQSSLGLDIDLERVAKLKEQLDRDLSDENLSLLIASGILRPSQPSRESTQRDHHPLTCKKLLTGKKSAKCDCPRKLTAPKKSSVDTKALHAHIEEVCKAHDLPVKRTDPSDKFPEGQVSAAADVLEDIADLSDVLKLFKFKTDLSKMRDVEIPRMSATPVHPHYDELKATGRTSCSASKLYPSGNVQNVDPRARECYIPSPGFWLLSVDISGMELVTLAQVILDMFGESTLAAQLQKGYDAHAYMGAQIVQRLAPKLWTPGGLSKDDHYLEFTEFKKTRPAFYKEWRNFSKPINLGLPGGMGAQTFVTYAKKSGVKVDLHTAGVCRDTWVEVYPEMPRYFDTIKRLWRDPDNSRVEQGPSGPFFKQRFSYRSPLGMVRRGCSFTEAANGNALQTPGAELAKLGMIRVCRAAFDPTVGSILCGRYRPLAFIHDEVLGEADAREIGGVGPTEIALEVDRLMVEGGKLIVPDIPLKTGQAYMLRWNKKAEAVWKDGKLVPWQG